MSVCPSVGSSVISLPTRSDGVAYKRPCLLSQGPPHLDPKTCSRKDLVEKLLLPQILKVIHEVNHDALKKERAHELGRA